MELKVILKPKDLMKATDSELFTLLEDLQKATTNVFNEAWRRGVHKELAERAMQMKHEGPAIQ